MESGAHFDEQLHTQPKHHSKLMAPTISLSSHTVRLQKSSRSNPHIFLIHSQFQSLTTSQRIGRIRLKSRNSGRSPLPAKSSPCLRTRGRRMDLPCELHVVTEIGSLQQAARQANTPLTTTGDTGVPSGHGKLRGGGVNVSRDALLANKTHDSLRTLSD